jgi:pyruvate kinase
MKPRRTKIVATIGPASEVPEVFERLLEAGLNVCRLNFSHGFKEDHAKRVEMIRAAASRRGQTIAILQDLQGPKIRTGRFKEGSVLLEVGKKFVITADDVEGDVERVGTTYKELPQDVAPGLELLLDDGNLKLRVDSVRGNEVHTTVLIGGVLKNNKGINIPGADLSTPAVTDKDIEDIKTGVELGVDWVAMSFVRNRDDILLAKEHLRRAGSRAKLMAKIEKPSAVDPKAFTEILEVVDGVMVARGDLGVELEPEKVPMIQKRLIEQCRHAGKPVITATQMLESMIQNARPTRAEASDVANAILDGTDAVMLSAESASGAYPVEAVAMMDRIAREVEASDAYKQFIHGNPPALDTTQDAVALASCDVADTLNTSALVVFTATGSSLWRVARNRPSSPILALTTSERARNQLALASNVTARVVPEMQNTDDMVRLATQEAIGSGLAQKGDRIVIVAGVPFGQHGSTNMLRVERI